MRLRKLRRVAHTAHYPLPLTQKRKQGENKNQKVLSLHFTSFSALHFSHFTFRTSLFALHFSHFTSYEVNRPKRQKTLLSHYLIQNWWVEVPSGPLVNDY